MDILHRYSSDTLLRVAAANLRGANLGEADLREADLREANLRGADLREANLYGADLRGANLRGAGLREADLREADLRGANLGEADLGGADLREANLRGANLYGAKSIPVLAAAQTLIVPPNGDLCGWKKCRGGVLVQLGIKDGVPRHNATGRKCRAERAVVIQVVGAEQGESCHRNGFFYRVGETVIASIDLSRNGRPSSVPTARRQPGREQRARPSTG